MKKLIALALILATTAHAEPSGNYLTWMGHDAGQYGHGDYTTLYGALSGGSASDFQRSSFGGVMSGYSSYYICDSLGFGFRAMQDAQYATNVVAFGSMAGRNVQNLDNCFLFGRNAGRDSYGLNNCFFVGTDAGRGLHDMTDRTYIIGQFYADKGSGSFYVRPNPGSDRDALTYSNGVLKIGTKVLSRRNERVNFSANLYLSGEGDDANDGLTLATAKRTLAGVVSAANAIGTNGLVVAVMDGDYEPPYSDFGADYPMVFRSVNGKADTRIVGGLNSVLAWSSSRCKWIGFTFTGFTGKGFVYNSDRVCRFGDMAFEDCDFIDNDFETEEAYTAYQLCSFVRCNFDRNAYRIATTGWGLKGTLYRGCDFFKTTIANIELYDTSGGYDIYHTTLLYDISAEQCLFSLPSSAVRNQSSKFSMKDVTIIAPSVFPPHFDYSAPVTAKPTARNLCPIPAFSGKVTNCFYVVGNFVPGMTYDLCVSATNYVEDAFVACASANLTADYVADDEDCPSVRDDGKKDYGWKSSAFGAPKYVRRVAAMLMEPPDAVRVRDPATGAIYLVTVDGGELNVSTVTNAVVEVSPPASNVVQSVSRPVLAASASGEDEDDPNETVETVGKFTVVRYQK